MRATVLSVRNELPFLKSQLAQGFRLGLVDRTLVCLKETMKLADTGGVAHLAQGFGLNLANPFASDLELATDFFEGATLTIL